MTTDGEDGREDGREGEGSQETLAEQTTAEQTTAEQTTAEQTTAEQTTAEQTLAALLGDLTQLRDYLRERGRHTYELAQRFLENARRDASARSYDERQATMLEYQHYLWHEIAGLVEKLLTTYGKDGGASQEGVAATTDEEGAGEDGRPAASSEREQA